MTNKKAYPTHAFKYKARNYPVIAKFQGLVKFGRYNVMILKLDKFLLVYRALDLKLLFKFRLGTDF